jgi:DNA topoisomerase I
MHELIITEKPSSAQKIAAALADDKLVQKKLNGVPYYDLTHKGKKITVASAVGHLFTVSEKKKSFTYPSFDLEWKPTYATDKKAADTKKFADLIRKEAEKAKVFTVACDYDIEGEVIGLNILRYLCNQKDGRRMKYSTLTKPDLVESYENASDTLDWGQAKAGETRHFLDWLYGINLSRALTLSIRKKKIYKTMSSGRVQGPALKILADREKEIQDFKKKKYWQISLKGIVHKSKIEAWHIKDKFWEEKEADEVLKKTKNKDGVIADVKKEESNLVPPYPFDLTTLQTEAYKVFGVNPKKTLDLAQFLYVSGFISYPRTSSQQLSPKLGFKKVIQDLARQPHYKKHADSLLAKPSLAPNNGKKTDPAHPAIYPTGIVPERLDAGSGKIYDLIVKRFFATFGEGAIRETTTAVIDVASEKFVVKGTRTKSKGWFSLYEPYVKLKDEELPALDKDMAVKTEKIAKIEKETQPPSRYNQASIIRELEKRNLGTKATRAQILQNLLDREYVEGTQLNVTDLGMKTIQTLVKYCPEITDEELTKSFEEEMENIREGKSKTEKILDDAKKDLTKILGNIKKNELEVGKELAESYKSTEKEKNFVGKCLACNKGDLEIRYSRKNKSRFIACDKYPDCKTIFSLPQKGIVKPTAKVCETCKHPIISVRNGRSGQEICINPECKTRGNGSSGSGKRFKEEGMECPVCKQGKMVLRKSFYGEFLGCNNYPKCKTMMMIKEGKVDTTPISGEKKKVSESPKTKKA